MPIKFDHPRIAIILSLLLIFLLRLYSVGGFHGYYSDIELENLGLMFEPLRESLAQRFNTLLPEDQAALASGILLGYKAHLSLDLKQSLTNTSTIHIVVVSGQNLTMLVGFLMSLASLIGRKKTILLSMVIVVLYSVLTGLQIPVIRASIMALAALTAQALGKEKEEWWILVLTGLIMIIFEPNWLLSLSFQLSFFATFAVVVIAPMLVARLSLLPNILKQDFSVSLATYAFTLPLIATTFQSISLVGVFVNTLILWTIPFIMISSAIALVVSFLLLPLGQVLALVPEILLTFFIYIVNFFNNIKLSHIKITQLPIVFWLGYYFLIIGTLLLLNRKSRPINPKA